MKKQTLISILALAISGNVAADCTATIIATINGGPAMKPVQIAIYQKKKLVTSTVQHSFTTTLTCGQTYTADLTLGNINRSRVFSTADSTTTVAVEMD